MSSTHTSQPPRNPAAPPIAVAVVILLILGVRFYALTDCREAGESNALQPVA